MTPREAAVQLGVSASMVYRACEERRLSHLRIGSRIVIEPHHLEEFRRSCEVEAIVVPQRREFKWMTREKRA